MMVRNNNFKQLENIMTKIPECFYPKILKDTIFDLRNEKNLNEDALKKLNGDFYANVIITVVCMFLISFLTGYTLLLSFLGIIIGIIIARYKLIQKSVSEILPYSLGEVKQGQITSQHYQEKRVSKYQYINNDDETIEKKLNFHDSIERMIVPDGLVDIYIHEGRSFPFLENRFRGSCLNQKRIDAFNARINSYDFNGY